MENQNTQSQQLGTAGSLPPLPTSNTGTVVTSSTSQTPGSEWPTKKKNTKWKSIIAGVVAILLVLGAAGSAFYFTRNLNQASVPTAPESEPQAAYVDTRTQNEKVNGCKQGCGADEVCRSGGRCVKVGGKLDNISAPTSTPYQCNSTNCPGPRFYCSSSTNCLDRGSSITAAPGTVGGSTYQASCVYIDGNDKATGNTCVKPGTKPGDNCDATGDGYYTCSYGCCAIANSEPTEKVGGGGGSTSNIGGVCTADAPTQATTSMARAATNSAEITWANNATTGSTKLWVSKSSNPASCTGATADCIVNGITLPLTTTSHRVTGLQPSTTYYWAVMSFVSSTCQELSTIANFTTGALACVNTTWTPNPNTVCTGTSLIQTSNCDATRSATGTKTDGTCAACVNTTWTPNQNTVCVGDDLTQTSNCGATRTVEGTKVCEEEGEPDLFVEKRAFEDEEDNKAGEYNLDDEIDTVSKEQVFVYAFDVYNAGDGEAKNIEISDTLKGNNQELLTYVDGDSRCKYTSSTRKVVCSGMNLESEEDDVYAFRVKVSDSAINGETIRNVGIVTYEDMPDDGETEASLELDISTVVSCNHNCTSDAECSSGLTCDPDVNKCRKAACLESSNCVCPLPSREPTEAPTKKATVTAKPQPTALPEAGILDLPGVAAFGGGLLLAIIGILLAL